MHEKVLTRVEPPQALLERLDARVKIACALVWAVSVVTLPAQHLRIIAAYVLVLLILLIVSYRVFGKFARRFGTALPVIALLVALLPFFQPGVAVWQFGFIEITREGLWSAQRVATSALLCACAICLVWATTPEPELLAGLKGVGLPALFVGVIGFMLRYLHVLRPELHRLWDARAARTIGGRNGARFRSAANLLGAFFLRSQERAVRVADAMAARGYDGHWRATPPSRLRPLHAAFGVIFITGLVLLRWLPCR